MLRAATLTALGNTTAIVANYLNDTMAVLADDDRTLAARCFDRLVTPSGMKVALTRADFARYTETDQPTVERLLQTLLHERLLQVVPSPTGESRYEITHDVLGQAILAWQTRHEQEQEAATLLGTGAGEGPPPPPAGGSGARSPGIGRCPGHLWMGTVANRSSGTG